METEACGSEGLAPYQTAVAAARAARLERVLAGAKAGLTLAQLGQQEGVSREGVRLWLLAVGLQIAEVRGLTCTYCQAPLQRGCPAPATGRHCCGRPACRRGAFRAYNADRRNPAGPVLCAHCQGPVRGGCRPGPGEVRFCMATACRAAKQRHRYATNAQHRGYVLAYRRNHAERAASRFRERLATEPGFRDRIRDYHRRYQARRRVLRAASLAQEMSA